MRKNGRPVTLSGGYQNCELTNVHVPYNITSYRCVKYKQVHILILEIINSDEAREHVGGKLVLYFFFGCYFKIYLRNSIRNHSLSIMKFHKAEGLYDTIDPAPTEIIT